MPQSHLHVKLLTHTPQSENTVSTAAKLCYSGADIHDLSQKITNEDQSEFIAKIVDMNHLSPFEHVSFSFAIEGVSRALLAQLTRHRIASFSVKSQRYVDHSKNADFEFIIPKSISQLGEEAEKQFCDQMQQINEWYKQWNEKLGGTKREDARFVLPNAAETKLIMTVNARELFHIFELRCCNRAQWEIRSLCWNMLGLCLNVAPSLFSSAGPTCCFKPCDQGNFSCRQTRNVALMLVKLKAFVAANSHNSNFEKMLSQWARENIN